MRAVALVALGLFALTPPAFAVVAEARPTYPLCSVEKLRSCIENGNTFWYGGEYMRLQDVGLVTQAACAASTERLFDLLNHQEIFVFRYGSDGQGHTLAHVIAGGQDVGQVLIAEGLAQAGGGAFCN